jgi:hypothetical protein
MPSDIRLFSLSLILIRMIGAAIIGAAIIGAAMVGAAMIGAAVIGAAIGRCPWFRMNRADNSEYWKVFTRPTPSYGEARRCG